MATTGFNYQGAPPPPNYYPPPPKFQSGQTDYSGYQSSQLDYQQQVPPYPPSGFTTTNSSYPSNVVVPAPQPLQQQQQQVYVINSVGQTTPVYGVNSYTGQLVLSCIVFWFFNWIFGLIAFILASLANNTAVADPNGARVLGRASYGMSIAGIVTSVIIVAVVVGVVVGSPTYYYYGYY